MEEASSWNMVNLFQTKHLEINSSNWKVCQQKNLKSTNKSSKAKGTTKGSKKVTNDKKKRYSVFAERCS